LEYETAVGCLQGIIDRHIGCQFIFGGDFNVVKTAGDTSSTLLHQFCMSNNISWLELFSDVCEYTYHNDLNSHFSLIDHFLSSPPLVDNSRCVFVMEDGDNPSDHLAIACTFNFSLSSSVKNDSKPMGRKLQWDRGDVDRYMYELSHKLSSIYISLLML